MRVRVALLLSCGLLGAPALAANPVPFLDNPVHPSTVLPGSAQIELTVAGSGFVSGSVVQWNGSARATTFVSDRKLTATIPASDLAAATSALVTVMSPGPGGGRSNLAYFQVVSPRDTVTFKKKATYASGSQDLAQPFNLITADFNSDGRLDLASANVGESTVSVFLGRADGTFNPQATFPAAFAIALAPGDFNNDGKIDLAVADSGAIGLGRGNLLVALGNGDGTFQAPTSQAAGQGPYSVAVGDLNRDGKLDAVVANYRTGANSIGVFLGRGDGTFRPRVGYATGEFPDHVAIGDVNGDGKLDVVVSVRDGNAPAIAVFPGNGDGTLGTRIDNPFVGDPIWSAVGDVNGDGKLDVAVVDNFAFGVSVRMGNGDGTFGAPSNYTTQTNVTNVAVGIADFDGDDLQDLVVDTSQSAAVLVATTPGLFQKDQRVAIANAQSIAIGDFNRDGRPDVAVVGWADENVTVLLQAP